MKILNINNTKVVYHYLPSRLTNIQIMTNIGSASESKDEWGFCHALEHSFFLGSKKYPGRLDISTTANDMGAKLNAWTWLDVTNYHITSLNEFFRDSFDLLADMYQNPLFPQDEVLKEISPILSEMRRGEDNSETFLGAALNMAMVGEEAGHRTIGIEDTVKSITSDKIKAFRARFYGGNNVMLSIVGGVSSKLVVDTISELFTLPQASEAPIVPVVKYNYGALELHKPGITEAIYSLNYPALNRFHPERYKQGLMTYVLGGSDSGMLHERIREELGLSCYGIYASQSHFDSFNVLDISTGIAPEQIEQCHEEVLGQIKKITTETLEGKRLARAKAAYRTSIAAASENSAGYNNSISTAILKGETENPLERLMANIEAVTLNDITEIAQKTFAAQPYKGVLLPE